MPLKYIFILSLTGWFAQRSLAQKVHVLFDMGIQQTSTSTKNFYSYFNEEGIEIYSQTPGLFLSVNCLIQGQILNSSFVYSTGLGLHRKGYIDRGFMELSGNGNYVLKFSKGYIPFFAGFNYRLLKNEKLSFHIGQDIVPELILKPGDLYKNFGFSTRTNCYITKQYKKDSKMHVSLYYQTAISNYNKTKILALGSNYRPYAFGVTIGYALPFNRNKVNNSSLQAPIPPIDGL